MSKSESLLDRLVRHLGMPSRKNAEPNPDDIRLSPQSPQSLDALLRRAKAKSDAAQGEKQ